MAGGLDRAVGGVTAGQVWELLLDDIDGVPAHRVTLLTLECPAPADRVYAKRETLARCVVLESNAEDYWPPGDIGDWELGNFRKTGTSTRIG